MHIQQHSNAAFTPDFLLLFLCQALLLSILPVSACCCDGFSVRALQGRRLASALYNSGGGQKPLRTRISYIICSVAMPDTYKAPSSCLPKLFSVNHALRLNDATRSHVVRMEATTSLLKMHARLNLLQLNDELKIRRSENVCIYCPCREGHCKLTILSSGSL